MMENGEEERREDDLELRQRESRYRSLIRYAYDMQVISNLFIFLAVIGGIIAALSFPLFLLPAAGLLLQAIVLRAVAKVMRILAEKD
jgi:hypothetical protein